MGGSISPPPHTNPETPPTPHIGGCWAPHSQPGWMEEGCGEGGRAQPPPSPQINPAPYSPWGRAHPWAPICRTDPTRESASETHGEGGGQGHPPPLVLVSPLCFTAGPQRWGGGGHSPARPSRRCCRGIRGNPAIPGDGRRGVGVSSAGEGSGGHVGQPHGHHAHLGTLPPRVAGQAWHSQLPLGEREVMEKGGGHTSRGSSLAPAAAPRCHACVCVSPAMAVSPSPSLRPTRWDRGHRWVPSALWDLRVRPHPGSPARRLRPAGDTGELGASGWS